ncbi:hypothetical protein CBR_g46611 [Chara braunii]|uniref:Reverse transcriptase domain-containing protein n=1 Tax=Chara braunii TaxID=69332 RepID=A0A388M0V9_CHABU|nr:hypothetical protein CBR_g46611 [Chara braunii]|eukprot:GBG88122.1 hypothetical protein CBR_g46611 [Chara braunii]
MRDNDIGLSNVIEHAILTGDHPPISCVPYRYSPAQWAATFQRIKEFEANGCIEPTIGPWSFPVVIVTKKAGGIRICIDYRKLNDITIKDVYPLPRIDELLDAIGSARLFSKFDVRHGFHHLLVREEDRPKMAFVLFEGTWQWVRCPMGICNAPAIFPRAMTMAFHNFVRKTRLAQSIINYCVIVYMDDILVYSSSYEGHVQHIEWTLHALRDVGFKVALEKCQFFLTTISFLGHVVTDQGLIPEPQKVAVVRDAPVPTTITQVRAFLGLASYYRRFIKGFAAIAGPLMNLLKKDQSLIWTPECDQAFSKLKADLISAPVLIRPDPANCVARDLCRSVCVLGPSASDVDDEHQACIEYLELMIIQAWRTDVEGDLLAFLFGSVWPGHRQPITQKLVVPLSQLADDLSLDIVSQSDDSPAPHVITRTLAPYLQWTACLEEPGSESTLPSWQEYLKPYGIIDRAFFPKEDPEEALEGEEEATEEEGDADEETSEEGSYSEYSEGEQTEEEEEVEEEDEEEEAGSEWEDLPEEVARTGREAEDPEEARRREEIAAGKSQLEFASEANLRIDDDPTRDPKPLEPEDDGPATAAPSASRQKRSRSPSPSTPAHPPVRPRTDAGNRRSSPIIIPPSP